MPSRWVRWTACADYSYDSRSYVGDNHILVGDAAAFIDPLFSSGVMMAMSSAAFGATLVEGMLDEQQPRERLVRDYERKIRLSLVVAYLPDQFAAAGRYLHVIFRSV